MDHKEFVHFWRNRPLLAKNGLRLDVRHLRLDAGEPLVLVKLWKEKEEKAKILKAKAEKEKERKAAAKEGIEHTTYTWAQTVFLF